MGDPNYKGVITSNQFAMLNVDATQHPQEKKKKEKKKRNRKKNTKNWAALPTTTIIRKENPIISLKKIVPEEKYRGLEDYKADLRIAHRRLEDKERSKKCGDMHFRYISQETLMNLAGLTLNQLLVKIPEAGDSGIMRASTSQPRLPKRPPAPKKGQTYRDIAQANCSGTKPPSPPPPPPPKGPAFRDKMKNRVSYSQAARSATKPTPTPPPLPPRPLRKGLALRDKRKKRATFADARRSDTKSPLPSKGKAGVSSPKAGRSGSEAPDSDQE